jgi:hypothetical protein
MKKREFKEAVLRLLSSEAEGLSREERIDLLRQMAVDAKRECEWDKANRGKPWTDDELRAILQTVPTRENCVRLARAFRRGYGSIEQIFRWASEDPKRVDANRADDAFIQQIRRIKKELGWVL